MQSKDNFDENPIKCGLTYLRKKTLSVLKVFTDASIAAQDSVHGQEEAVELVKDKDGEFTVPTN